MTEGIIRKTVIFGSGVAVVGFFVVEGVCADDLLIRGDVERNGLNVTVHASENFMDRVEIYTCSNLVSGDWRVVTGNLLPVAGNPAQWRTEATNGGFFVAGNMDMDSDVDGLPDAREKYVHKTNPYKADSDDDGMPDKWEAQHALNPLNIEDALADPDGDGFNNLEAYQTSPDLSESDTDGDGFVDSFDLRVNEFDYPVVGEGIFNLVASWWYTASCPAPGFGPNGEQVLTLRWSDSFWYPDNYMNEGQRFTAGVSVLHWTGTKLPDMDENGWVFENRYWDTYWKSLSPLYAWTPPLNVFMSERGLDGPDVDIFSLMEYVLANKTSLNVPPCAESGTIYNADEDIEIPLYTVPAFFEHHIYTAEGIKYYYLCAAVGWEYSEPAPPLCHTSTSGKMKATDGELESYGTSTFKFVFNQPVTNRIVKWLTYHYDYDIPAYVDYVVNQCEVNGTESVLLSSSSMNMVAPRVDLSGDFDSDGDIDDLDAALRALASACIPITVCGQAGEVPDSKVVPLKINADLFAIGMPESVLKVKISGVDSGERFRLWSTTNIVPNEPVALAMQGGGGGWVERIVDPPLLIDTDTALGCDWPVKNISPLTPGYSYICAYTYTPEFPKTLYMECLSCDATNDGRAKVELVYEYNGEEICSTALPITVVRSKLVPDWNHDRIIDMTDQNQNTNNAPLRFWINDDNDSGDISEGDSDLPGQGGGWLGFEAANYKDDQVNGRSDLIDFFPVWLDIKSVLEHHPVTNGAVYKLHQADGALKFVYTDLTITNAGDYLITSNSACGVAMNQNSYEADTIRITSDGVMLSADFLNRIAADTNKGILMMEAVAPSASPLVLEIWQGENKVWETSLALSLSGVEDMYRKINLRSMEDAIQQDPPANYPDGLSNGKNVVFLHGFSLSEQAARGWHAEMFKRLYWSGSMAMFHAVTWRGDDSDPIDPLYQENVNNAFLTAPYLARYVNDLSGDKILLAHSLGNMIVSSAIQDYGMNAAKYLMLDAAVATECYDPGTFNAATNNNPMLHVDWRLYQPKTWASKWHELFSAPDSRAKLTWRNRFSAVFPKAYNFYSSEDEVFEIYTNVLDVLTGVDLDFAFSFLDDTEHYSWHKQEMFKGLDGSLVHSLGATDWAGWGFHKNILGFRVYSLGEANIATDEALIAESVFRKNPADIFSSQLDPAIVNEALAKGVPALSFALGRCPLTLPDFENYDMVSEKPVLWARDHETYGKRWLHSDIKDVAYPYVYKTFGQIVEKGELQ